MTIWLGYAWIGERIWEQVARFNHQPRESLPLGFVVWDELFLGMTGASWAKKGFDQNRLFVGPAVFAFEGIFRVEVGYPFNYLSRTPNRIPTSSP